MKIDRTKLKKSSSEVVSTNVTVVWLLPVLVAMPVSVARLRPIMTLLTVGYKWV